MLMYEAVSGHSRIDKVPLAVVPVFLGQEAGRPRGNLQESHPFDNAPVFAHRLRRGKQGDTVPSAIGPPARKNILSDRATDHIAVIFCLSSGHRVC